MKTKWATVIHGDEREFEVSIVNEASEEAGISSKDFLELIRLREAY